jgi:hypothetical protein
MPLMCRLGLHRPAEGEVWNRGYWFTTCERCKRDLVRTAAGRWHVPAGRQIVWKTKKPRIERKRDGDDS